MGCNVDRDTYQGIEISLYLKGGLGAVAQGRG